MLQKNRSDPRLSVWTLSPNSGHQGPITAEYLDPPPKQGAVTPGFLFPVDHEDGGKKGPQRPPHQVTTLHRTLI
ncbi:unnamed protein product [Gadus morhua 'NCC']